MRIGEVGEQGEISCRRQPDQQARDGEERLMPAESEHRDDLTSQAPSEVPDTYMMRERRCWRIMGTGHSRLPEIRARDTRNQLAPSRTLDADHPAKVPGGDSMF